MSNSPINVILMHFTAVFSWIPFNWTVCISVLIIDFYFSYKRIHICFHSCSQFHTLSVCSSSTFSTFNCSFISSSLHFIRSFHRKAARSERFTSAASKEFALEKRLQNWRPWKRSSQRTLQSFEFSTVLSLWFILYFIFLCK